MYGAGAFSGGVRLFFGYAVGSGDWAASAARAGAWRLSRGVEGCL